MKNSEKNSSKVNTNNTNVNEVLSPETIKAQLKAACNDMNAAQTKEYIKGLDGYELKLTGQKPTQHYTVFFGDVRICNVEQVQGIKADGSSRGCVSVAKVNFLDKVSSIFAACIDKMQLTDNEGREAKSAFESAFDNLQKIQNIFDTANERAAAKAKEAAKEAAKIKKVEKITETMTLEQMMKQAELLAAAIEKAKAAN